jgi:hypothetical protein
MSYKIGDKVVLEGVVGVITDGPGIRNGWELYEVKVVVNGHATYPRVYGYDIKPAP